MKSQWIRTSKAASSYCAAILRSLWTEPFLQLRPAPEALELALRSSPRLRLAHGAMVVVVVYLLELLLTGHGIAAAVLALLGGPACWKSRAPADADPRCLVLATDGRLFLKTGAGELEEVRLRPASLRLGSHVLLVLAAAGRDVRLLFGPDNLAPAELAALRCRLPNGSAAAGTALHSPAASRRSDRT